MLELNQRLCLQWVSPDDQAAVASVELIVRERLKRMGKEGKFYPAEEADQLNTGILSITLRGLNQEVTTPDKEQH